VLGWNPTSLTGTQIDSVLSFAPALTPVKGRIKLIKTNHSPEEVHEVERQIRVLVRDTAKKLQATNDRLQAERAQDPIDAAVCDIQSKCAPPFTLCDSTTSTHSFSSGPISIGPLRNTKGRSGSTLFDEQAQRKPGTPSCTTPGMTKTRAEGLGGES